MRRFSSIATLAVLLLTAQAWPQMRGHAGMSGGHGSIGVHGSAGGFRGTGFGFRSSGFGFRSGFGAGFGSGFGRPFFRGRFHHHHRFFFAGGFGFPFFGYPFYSYPYDYAYYSAPANSSSDSYYADQERRMEDRLDRLEDRIDSMREEERYRREAELTQPKLRAPNAGEVQATVLVFRDKHREEVQNYGIVGQTLWVFTEQRARKISVAELDVPATTRANEERGVQFQVPTTSH